MSKGKKEEGKTVNVWEALADFIAEQDYGTVIHYQDIEYYTHFRRKTQDYYNAVQKAKKLLMERGKAIKSLYNNGDYQVIHPGDYTREYARDVSLARKRIRHGEKLLDGAPVADMTKEERGVFQSVYDFHHRMSAQIKGNYVEVRQLVQKRANPLAQAASGKGE